MPSHRDESGQSTVEWLGLVLVVSMVVLAIATLAGARLPGYVLARTLAERLICAAGLGDGACGAPIASELAAAYGAELADEVRRRAPTIAYEEGMRAVPVDFRSCRSDPCSMGEATGEVTGSLDGEPVTLFVHVIDCRADAAPALRQGADCSGDRAGYLYLQYWAYYPGSQSLRALPGKAGFHRDDWESWQLRIGDSGSDARASSHRGYNYEGGPGNWLSDAGVTTRDAWGPSRGRYYVSGGSHAGHAAEDEEELVRWTPRGAINLVPVEEVARGRWGSTRFAVTPPWLKQVYRDPEDTGTD